MLDPKQHRCACCQNQWLTLRCRPGHFFASSDKAKRELGWKPEHTFTQDAAEVRTGECLRQGAAGSNAWKVPLCGFQRLCRHSVSVALHTQLVEAYKASGRLDQEMDFSGGSV